MAIFDPPPTQSTPVESLTNHQIFVTRDYVAAAPTAVPNVAQIRPWGLLGKWVKYNEFFVYLFIPFSGTRLQVIPVD